MFTVRIDHGQGSRQIYACASYSVQEVDGNREVKLMLADTGPTPREVVLANGGVAYVMNASGVTVDAIRTTRRAS